MLVFAPLLSKVLSVIFDSACWLGNAPTEDDVQSYATEDHGTSKVLESQTFS